MELGVQDNYVVLFADTENLLQGFCQANYSVKFHDEKLTIYQTAKPREGVELYFYHNNPGPIHLGVGFTTHLHNARKDPKKLQEIEALQDRLERDYPVGVTLHPERGGNDTEGYRILADLIIDLCEYAIQKNIGICIPSARDLRKGSIPDLDNLVMFNPKK